VIGFPALASTSMEQGRLAGCHMFGKPSRMLPNLIPYGIYTIPEISMVGATEEELTRARLRMRAGWRVTRNWRRADAGRRSRTAENSVRSGYAQVAGVHIIGDRAAEIVHIGQAVLTMGGRLSISRYGV